MYGNIVYVSYSTFARPISPPPGSELITTEDEVIITTEDGLQLVTE